METEIVNNVEVVKTVVQNLAVAIAITTGMVEVLKKTGMNTKLAPLASLASGVLCVFLLSDGVFQFSMIALGLVAGLSASGLYSGAKKATEKY